MMSWWVRVCERANDSGNIQLSFINNVFISLTLFFFAGVNFAIDERCRLSPSPQCIGDSIIYLSKFLNETGMSRHRRDSNTFDW